MTRCTGPPRTGYIEVARALVEAGADVDKDLRGAWLHTSFISPPSKGRPSIDVVCADGGSST